MSHVGDHDAPDFLLLFEVCRALLRKVSFTVYQLFLGYLRPNSVVHLISRYMFRSRKRNMVETGTVNKYPLLGQGFHFSA